MGAHHYQPGTAEIPPAEWDGTVRKHREDGAINGLAKKNTFRLSGSERQDQLPTGGSKVCKVYLLPLPAGQLLQSDR